MHLPLLQALIQNEVPRLAINNQHLVAMSEKYQNPQSSEYKLVELALNIVLGSYLEKANKLL